LSDTQAAYATDTNPIWSISETVTHLIYSQNGYHNWLLDVTVSYMPHLVEAAKGFGQGARPNRPAEELRLALRIGTDRIREAIDITRPTLDPKRVVPNPLFGEVDYTTLILLLCAHEVDHVRQAIIMRRLSRNFTDPGAQLPPTPEI